MLTLDDFLTGQGVDPSVVERGNVVGSVGVGDVQKCVSVEVGSQAGHNINQDDKAAKVAALSQALNYIDKFRRNQVRILAKMYLKLSYL